MCSTTSLESVFDFQSLAMVVRALEIIVRIMKDSFIKRFVNEFRDLVIQVPLIVTCLSRLSDKLDRAIILRHMDGITTDIGIGEKN